MYGGLISALRSKYYWHYNDYKSKRNHKTVKVIGSSIEQGKQVDTDIAAYIEGLRTPEQLHPMAVDLLKFWADKKHTLQAGQVPVVLNGMFRMTQADLITRDAKGKLWLWEIKTGAPTKI